MRTNYRVFYPKHAMINDYEAVEGGVEPPRGSWSKQTPDLS